MTLVGVGGFFMGNILNISLMNLVINIQMLTAFVFKPLLLYEILN